MKIARLVARILLGLAFVGTGAMSFIITSPPPLPGLAGTFNAVFYASHWAQFVGFAQVVAGVLLLANRFVPVALIILAAFLYNSFAFHITMAQSALFAPIVVLALWLLIATEYRAVFAPIFTARPLEHVPVRAGGERS